MDAQYRVRLHIPVPYLWPFDIANCQKPGTLLQSLGKFTAPRRTIETPRRRSYGYEKESRLGKFLQSRDSEPPTTCPTYGRTVSNPNHHGQELRKLDLISTKQTSLSL